MSQGASTPQVPLEIVGIATMHRLGTPQRVFAPAREPLLGRLMGYFSLITGCLILITFSFTYQSLFSWWPAWQVALIVLVALAWLVLGAWILLTPLTLHRLRVFLCPEGLIYVRTKPEVIRWDQMERIWKSGMGSREASAAPSYVVRRSDDMLFPFDNDLADVKELGLLMEREITSRLLPRAIAAFDAGGPVAFDEIVVSRRGIGVREGRRWLPWQEFAGMSMGETSIVMYQRDAGAWATLALANVPNVEILKRLVEYVVREQARRQLPQILDYNAGLVVRFGVLSLSKRGLSIDWEKRGRLTFAWNEIESIGVGQREVIIRRKGPAREWYTLPTWMVEDREILRELVEHIQRYKEDR